MKLTLEFFGPLRDRVGQASTVLTLVERPQSIPALIETLVPLLESGEALRDPHLRVAINDQFCSSAENLMLHDHDRVAFLSPFSGG
ncbi:MoaD/ThiS family protein [Hyphobacterium marinum]|uniref:MoaD/ThiS family protein n=1 Tax=Hyphobacterium marinum TaxID=3116574 RepID=A0ABU7LU75_9PROT|nr:MoaD/ThiS family protein [Hyphobacterium sp. Y6023]MEE2565100.1 MoaD/ThiS family protein [Hyphobacterium sp. Y6023]